MNERIKINDKIYFGTIKKIDINKVKVLFEKNIPKPERLQNGFYLVDSKERIYGDFTDFNTIFKQIEAGYILSNDQSVYMEPEKLEIPELSQEELKEQELQQKIIEKQNKIDCLKDTLQSSDYKIIKGYEYFLANKVCEYDFITLHEERQEIRDRINEKEAELSNLMN